MTYQERGAQLADTMGKSKAAFIAAILCVGALPFASSAYAETESSADGQIQPALPSGAPGQPETPSPNAPAAPSPDGSAVQSPNESAAPSPSAPAAQPHDLQSFYLDSREFKLGDVVPDLYRTKSYEITDWKTRHLPAPDLDSHWTYMGGNYVLITNADGKILKLEPGNIFSPM